MIPKDIAAVTMELVAKAIRRFESVQDVNMLAPQESTILLAQALEEDAEALRVGSDVRTDIHPCNHEDVHDTFWQVLQDHHARHGVRESTAKAIRAAIAVARAHGPII